MLLQDSNAQVITAAAAAAESWHWCYVDRCNVDHSHSSCHRFVHPGMDHADRWCHFLDLNWLHLGLVLDHGYHYVAAVHCYHYGDHLGICDRLVADMVVVHSDHDVYIGLFGHHFGFVVD